MNKSLLFLLVLSCCLWGAPLAAQSIEECSSPGTAVPSYGSLTDDIEVSESVVVGEAVIFVDMTATWVYAVSIAVESAEGTNVTLKSLYSDVYIYKYDFNCNFAEFGATLGPIIYDYTTTPSKFSCGGCFLNPSSGDLGNLTGQDSAGTWTLSTSNSNGYAQTLNTWCVKLYDVAALRALSCIASPTVDNAIDISWTNGQAYDAIYVSINNGADEELAGVTLDAGAANTFTTSALVVPQLATVKIWAVSGGTESATLICRVSLAAEPVATLTSNPDPNIDFNGYTGSAIPMLVDQASFDTDVTINDLIVNVDVSGSWMYYMSLSISSPAGTTVGLKGLYTGDSSGAALAVDVNFWHYGRAFGTPFTGGATMKPTGPGNLSQFFGETTVDEDEGNNWVMVASMGTSGFNMTMNDWSIGIYDAAPALAPNGVTCSAGAGLGEVVFSFINNGDYDAIWVYANDELIADSGFDLADGASNSVDYSFTTLPASVGFCVQGVKLIDGENAPGNLACCSATASLPSISDVTCNSEAGTGVVDLAWVNSVAYDEINIYVDGSTIPDEVIDGSETSWSSGAFSIPSGHSFAVQGVVSVTITGVSSKVGCQILLLDAMELEVCSTGSESATGDSEFVLTVEDAGTVEDVEVLLDVTTTWFQDITISLESPSGENVTLKGSGYGSGTSASLPFLHVYTADGEVTYAYDGFDYNCACEIAPSDASGFGNMIGASLDGDWLLKFNTYYLTTVDKWCLRLDFCPLLPPVDFAVEAASDDTVDLSWTNGDTYDSVEVYQDDVEIASLSGSAESTTVSGLAVGRYSFRVIGISAAAGCNAPSAVARIGVGFSEICNGGSDVDVGYNTPSELYPIDVAESYIVGDVEATLDMDLYWTTGGSPIPAAYWNVWVESPIGTQIKVLDQDYGNTGDFFRVIWSDAGSSVTNFDCGFCLAAPDNALSGFTGEISDGTWGFRFSEQYFSGGTSPFAVETACLALYQGCDLSPPSELVCEQVAGTKDVALDWTNNDTYDSISVTRNGLEVASISGSAESYTDESLLSDFYSYRVIGIGSCEAGARPCKTSVGIIEVCNDTDSPDGGVGGSTSSEIEVADDISLEEIRVLAQISSSFTPGLSVDLESAAGSSLVLFPVYTYDSVYYGGVDATFAEGGSTLASVAFNCMCLIQPEDSFEDLAGESSLGTWTLTATDSGGGGYAGSITNWCVQIYIGCPIAKPVIDSCTTDAGVAPVTINWTNFDSYDEIQVYRDGVLIDSLAGDAEEYTDTLEGAAAGVYSYNVLAVSIDLDCASPSKPCSVAVGRLDSCQTVDGSFGYGAAALSFLDYQNDTLDGFIADCDEFDPNIADLQIHVDLAYPWTGYLNLVVFSPDHTDVTLMAYSGGSGGPTSATTVLVDFSSSGPELSSANAACDCSVLPMGPGSMSDFAGQDPRGEWIMAYNSVTTYTGTNVFYEWCVGVYTATLGCEEPPPPEGKFFKRGDVDNNGTVAALADSLRLLNWQFNGAATPPCMAACDVDNNGTVAALADSLRLLNWQFNGAAAPPAPGTSTCGTDPENAATGGVAAGCTTMSNVCDPGP